MARSEGVVPRRLGPLRQLSLTTEAGRLRSLRLRLTLGGAS